MGVFLCIVYFKEKTLWNPFMEAREVSLKHTQIAGTIFSNHVNFLPCVRPPYI